MLKCEVPGPIGDTCTKQDMLPKKLRTSQDSLCAIQHMIIQSLSLQGTADIKEILLKLAEVSKNCPLRDNILDVLPEKLRQQLDSELTFIIHSEGSCDENTRVFVKKA